MYSNVTSEKPHGADPNRCQRPVFLVGIHRRCGSNFLADALRLVPDFQLPNPIAEDYLLQHAGRIAEYVERTAREQYEKRFSDHREFHDCRARMYRHLGDGLLQFLRSYLEPGRRLLSKTPDPWGLEYFFQLFPDCLLVLVVRDGRDVVESAARSWPHEPVAAWMTAWAENARQMVRFLDRLPDSHRQRVILVRYEDLLAGRDEMSRLLTFLGLDPQEYPWDELDDMLVRGSSDLRSREGQLHWKPVEKPADFRPVGRWQNWSFWRRLRFKRIAGRELIALDYASDNRW